MAGAGLSLIDPLTVQAMVKKSEMKLGLVTYLWGRDWDLPTLIANCEKTGFLGVELRTAACTWSGNKPERKTAG